METEIKETQQEAGENTVIKQETETTARRFTQEEVNEIVKSRLERERKNLPSKEELQRFNEWKKEQQTEREQFEELKKQFEEMQNENKKLKLNNLVQKENVNEMFQEFVIDKLLKTEGIFEDNLKEFKAKNPQFFTTESQKVSTVPNLTKTAIQEQKPKKLLDYF